jgi:hypothetical protein
MKKTTLLPRARTDGLVIEELTDEVLVYDLQRNKAHCLNSTAAAVWKHCDGRRTVEQIARRLSEPGAVATGQRGIDDHGLKSVPLDEAIVWLALEQLGRDHLLEERVLWPVSIPRMSRREAIKLFGLAAIAVPVVVSIIAPTAAQAGTCKPHGQPCGTGSQCCSTVCSGGSCV